MCDSVPLAGLDVQKVFLLTPGSKADAGGLCERV